MIQIEVNLIPPSLNSSYATNFKTGRRFPSKELADFKKQFLFLAKKPAKGEIEKLSNKRLIMMIELWCNYERLFTKKNTIKKFDCSNRIKALEDCVCELIGIDDSHVFRLTIEKNFTILDERTVVTVMEHR